MPPVLASGLGKDGETLAYDDHWSKISSSDESKYDLISHRAQFVHRRPGERCDPKCILRQAHRTRGQVMVWGPFSSSGFTPLVRLEGRFNSAAYVEMLQNHLIPALHSLLPDGGKFQQDNAPIHTAAATRRFFQTNNITTIDWPAFSPDMNPIENVWGRMAKTLEPEKIADSEELFQKLFEIWDRLMSDEEYRLALTRSMPNRAETLLKLRGGNTNY